MPETFDKKEITAFLEKEFVALRQEITECKAREFQIVVSGIVGTPVLAYISLQDKVGEFHFPFLRFLLPVIVIVIALLYIAERHAIMRAGTYIRDKIEPIHTAVCGWEQWLSCDDKIMGRSLLRAADKSTVSAFSLLFISYYIGASRLAMVDFKGEDPIKTALVAAYVSLGILFCYVL